MSREGARKCIQMVHLNYLVSIYLETTSYRALSCHMLSHSEAYVPSYSLKKFVSSHVTSRFRAPMVPSLALLAPGHHNFL